MKRKRISYLLKQFIDGVITQDERQELFGYLEEDNSIAQAVITGMLEEQTPVPLSEMDHWKGMLEKILEVDKSATVQPGGKRDKRLLPFFYRIAAVFFILFSVGGYLFLNRQRMTAKKPLIAQVIPPGGNKAVLTLANGSTIVLDSAHTGELVKQGGVAVNKMGEGQLAYHSSAGNSPSKVIYNTLSTPKSGQFQLTLADGTRVWLNSASSIKYFTSFSGGPRKIELNGEAYFEVAKHGKNAPFLVSVNGAQVAVLGTHFNIMAYQDEPTMKTTLLEGSIMMSLARNKQLLQPGQQAQIPLKKANKDSKFHPEQVSAFGKISVVDLPEAAGVIAWKQGNFMFAGESIQSIMRKLSRWYDLDVQYKGTVTREGFNGTISRFEPASEVFKMLELTGLLHFKVDGRSVVVMP